MRPLPPETEPTPSPEESIAFLHSNVAADILADLSQRDTSDAHALHVISMLRKTLAPWQASALLAQAQLRKRAAAKWPFAQHLFLIEEAMEQATAWPVAVHRAQRMHELAPPGPLLDLGCGIGGDTLALALFRPVIAWESDPTRAAFARANLDAIANLPGAGPLHPVEIRSGDWTAAALPDAAAAFADPARRISGARGESRRVFSLHTMQPPIERLLPLLEHLPLLVVKVAPGVPAQEVSQGAALEFVSHEGTCKEGVLWLGSAAADLPQRWASVHTHQSAPSQSSWAEVAAGGQRAPVLAPEAELQAGQIIWEPDPAVIRAGALDTLCTLLQGRLIAEQIAYLVCDAPVGGSMPTASPLAVPFRLLEAAPFNLKRLNRRLAELDVGTVELKKRGFPLEPEELRPRLKVKRGGRPLTVLLTRRDDVHWMLLAERIGPMPTDPLPAHSSEAE